MAKRKRLKLNSKSIEEINEILKDGVRIRAYEGCDIEKKEFYRGKDAVLPNSMWAYIYAKEGMSIYRSKDGKLYTDEVIYMDFNYKVNTIEEENESRINNIDDKIKKEEEDLNDFKNEIMNIEDTIESKAKEVDCYRKKANKDEKVLKAMRRELKGLKAKNKEKDNIIQEYENKIKDLQDRKVKIQEAKINKERESIFVAELRKKYYTEGFIIEKYPDGKLAKQDDNGNYIIEVSEEYTDDKGKKKSKKIDKPYDGEVYEYHYKVTMQNASKTRVGKCIFVLDEIRDKATQEIINGRKGFVDKVLGRMSMGITDYLLEHPEKQFSYPTLEAYTALSQSAILNGYIQLAPENVLIVKDYTHFIDYKARIVTVNEEKNNLVVGEEEITKLQNILWDGMGLLDAEYFKGLEQYSVILLRQLFFKACMTKCNLVDYIKAWCKETGNNYETYKVKDFLGREVPIKNVRCITTTNAVKWSKFSDILFNDDKDKDAKMYDHWKSLITKDWSNHWAVVKHDYETSYDSHNLVRASYQLINSLIVNEDKNVANSELRTLFRPTEEYLTRLNINIEDFKTYLIDNCAEQERAIMWLSLLESNPEIEHTKQFKNYKDEIINKLKDEATKDSRLLFNGNNLVLIGNPVELVEWVLSNQETFDWSFGTEDIGAVKCYTPRFEIGDEIVGMRSPHNYCSGYVLMKNCYNEKLMKLAPDLNSNVIVVDAQHYPTQDSWNGQDYDVDSINANNNKDFVKIVKQYNWGKVAIPVNAVPQETKKYNYTLEEKCKCNLSLKNIWTGEATNLCQIAVSQVAHIKHNKDKFPDWEERIKGLEDIIIGLVIATNIAIDNAKRKYDIDMKVYLREIRKSEWWLREDDKEDGKIIKPDFFKSVVKKNKKSSYFEAMDCNCDKINLKYKNLYKRGLIDIVDLIELQTSPEIRIDQRQEQRILDSVIPTQGKIKTLRAMAKENKDDDDDNTFVLVQDAKDEFKKKLSTLKINIATYSDILIKCFEDENWKTYRGLILSCLLDRTDEDGNLMLKKCFKNV